MALNITVLNHYPNRNQFDGSDQDQVRTSFTFTVDNPYTAGGEDFLPVDIEMETIDGIVFERAHVSDTVTRVPQYDRANDQIVIIEHDTAGASGDEQSEASGDISATTFRAMAWGQLFDSNRVATP